MRAIFILLIVGIIAPVGLMAQRMIVEGTGSSAKLILDMTVEAGMPVNSQTTAKKYPGTYTVSNAAFLQNLVFSDGMNAEVYRKLEIATQDLGTSGLGAAMAMQWNAAFNACRGLNNNGTGWRLPTQRELQMVRVFRDPIEQTTSVAFVIGGSGYWTATEYNATFSWTVLIYDGNMQAIGKSNNRYARCVREVD